MRIIPMHVAIGMMIIFSNHVSKILTWQGNTQWAIPPYQMAWMSNWEIMFGGLRLSWWSSVPTQMKSMRISMLGSVKWADCVKDPKPIVQVSLGCPRIFGTQSSWSCLQDTLQMCNGQQKSCINSRVGSKYLMEKKHRKQQLTLFYPWLFASHRTRTPSIICTNRLLMNYL